MNTNPLARYELLEKIGAGGMGEVFLAQDTMLERRVALKFLPEELQRDTDAKQRFLREAKSAAALDHPYICKIYEIGGEDRPFIAMEYVQGESLARRLQRGPLALNDALRLAAEIAEALETAHGQDIVHRDLKPSNIMLTESDHVKVVDFGLAKRVESSEGPISELETAWQLTRAGMAMGTPAYMSPEQMRAEPVDRRSDIFSFGVVLYEMLTGVHPFAKETPIDTASAILNLPTPSLSGQQRELPELLDHVVGKMTAKSAEERYQQAREVRIDLNGIRESSRAGVTTEAQEQHPAAKIRSRTLLGVGAIALLALSAGAAWWIGSTGSREPQSVAVLPLRNVNDDGGLLDDTEYIAQGISCAVSTRLTQAGLRVTPCETALRFADTDDPQRVAQDLNVDAVLTGRLQVVDERMLITLSMVDADSGLQSWADTFEAPSFENIFDVQERIAVAVAGSLGSRLTGEVREVLATPESQSAEAYEFYLEGAYYLQEGTREGTDLAWQYFSEAVRRDPTMAKAYVGLGAAHEQRYWVFGGSDEDLNQAKASYETALDLDESSMTARRGLALVHWFRGESEAALRLGLEAGRSGRDDVETLLTRAVVYDFSGLHDFRFGLPLYREVLKIDPVNREARWWSVVTPFANVGSEAPEAAAEYFRLFGDEAELHQYVAFHHHFSGNTELARQHYESVMGEHGSADDPHASTLYSFLFAGMLLEQLGEVDRAEQAWQQGKELAEQMLPSAFGNSLLGLTLASFHTVLGDEVSAAELENDSLTAPNLGPWGLMVLAAAHAKQGRPDRAVEILRRGDPASLSLDLLEAFFRMADLPLPATEEFEQLLADIEEAQQRLLQQYGPRAEADRRR